MLNCPIPQRPSNADVSHPASTGSAGMGRGRDWTAE